MFYKNLKKYKKILTKELIFNKFGEGIDSEKDSQLISQSIGKMVYNYTFSDGSLKTGLGFRDLTLPISIDGSDIDYTLDFKSDKILSIWYARWYNYDIDKYFYILFFMREDYLIRHFFLEDKYKNMIFPNSRQLTSIPICFTYRINDEDYVVFSSETDGLLTIYVRGSKLYTNIPRLVSCVVHYDKFFGITSDVKNKLIYSSNLDFTTWNGDDESTVEFLDNRGSFTKVISFNDYVFVFREHGITKLSVYSVNSELSVTHIWTSSTLIYKNTIEVCGERVLFMTRDGLYSFNGSSVKKIETEFDDILVNMEKKNSYAAFHDGKYYLIGRYNFDDGEIIGCENDESFINNVLIEIDVDTFKMNVLRGVDINKLVAIDNPNMSRLAACFNGEFCGRVGELTHDGEVMGNSLKKIWRSAKNDLGYAGKLKRIKEVIIQTDEDCQIKISSDRETKNYNIKGKNKEQIVNVNVLGNIFEISYITENKNYCKISAPKIIFDVQV